MRLSLLLVFACLISCGKIPQEASPTHSGWAKSIVFTDKDSGKDYEIDTMALFKDSEGNTFRKDIQLLVKVYETKVDVYLGSSGRATVPQLSKSLNRKFVKNISWTDGYTNLPRK